MHHDLRRQVEEALDEFERTGDTRQLRMTILLMQLIADSQSPN
jgi:hypothetical protein